MNRDEHPVAVAESLVLGSEVAGGLTLSGLLRGCGPWTVAVPMVGVLATAGAALVRARKRSAGGPRPALLLAAFVTGLAGMALQVGLLEAYQNVRGCVYQEVGGIIACFMVGLALGARLGEALIASARWRLVAGLGAMIALAIGLPGATRLLAGLPSDVAPAVGFWALVFAVGFLDGAVLPAVVTCASRAANDGWGSRVYAFDLIGAALGAVVCGAVWIPFFGMTGAMLAVAGLLVVTLVAVVVARA